MDKQFTTIGFLFLLTLSSANVYAEPAGRWREEQRVAGNDYQLQGVAFDRGREGEQPRQIPPRRPRVFDLPDTSGYGAQDDNGQGVPDNYRKQGKLSSEEKRALRRQIDEVGHDLYLPKR
jgi:hypothetical protein